MRRGKSPWPVVAFLAPAALVYAVFFGYATFFLARTSTKRVSLSLLNPVSVGLGNYAQLAQSPLFRRSLFNTLAFGGISIAAALTLAFFVAMALASGRSPHRFLFAVFLAPALMPLSLVSAVFGAMLQERFGIVNETLRALGLGGLAQSWLTEPTLAFGSIAALFCYLIGLPILYYTADLSRLPIEPLEAALIDGARTFQIWRLVVYPMMRSTHITVILALLLGAFRALEQVLFTTGGGPAGSTEIVGTFLYRFSTDPGATTGFVSAAAVVILLIAAVISIGQMATTVFRGKGMVR